MNDKFLYIRDSVDQSMFVYLKRNVESRTLFGGCRLPDTTGETRAQAVSKCDVGKQASAG